MDGVLFAVIGTVLSVTTASLAPAASRIVKGSDPVPIWHNDSSDTRLLLGPTARSLKRGEAYVDDVSVFFPSVQVGLSDRVSIGAGTCRKATFVQVTPSGSRPKCRYSRDRRRKRLLVSLYPATPDAGPLVVQVSRNDHLPCSDDPACVSGQRA